MGAAALVWAGLAGAALVGAALVAAALVGAGLAGALLAGAGTCRGVALVVGPPALAGEVRGPGRGPGADAEDGRAA